MISPDLFDEAKAFDGRILERVANGLIPDLRNASDNDWFFNNPWRKKAYVKMIFGSYLDFALKHLSNEKGHVLEIGSGLGHMCLELGRNGYHVTGVELSPESVRVANEYYSTLTVSEKGTGTVNYLNDDFMNWKPDRDYDAICFFLTLHHFPDPAKVIDRVKSFLKPKGQIIVVEPARDLFSKRNASIVALIRILLSINNNWHEKINIPEDISSLNNLSEAILDEYREAKDHNEKEQSPNDNSSYASTMIEALNKYFEQETLTYGNTISPRLLGGVRAENEDETIRIASFIKLFDEYATSQGIIEPGVFYYAGKLK